MVLGMTLKLIGAFALMTSILPLSAIAGPAINQFEVKDLQSSPGEFEFQSQNAYATGQPRRKTDGTNYDDNTVIRQREALEVQVGITDYFRVRVGIEFEQELLDDPETFSQANRFADLELDELALEGVIVFIKPKKEGIGLGLLIEYGLPVSGGSESQSELYIGPIIEAHTGAWTLIANLALVQFIGGGGGDAVKDEKLDFSYFIQGKYDFSESFGLALEAYGTIDRLGNSGRRSEESEIFGDFNQHRAGPVAYYTFFPHRSHTTTSQLTTHSDDDAKELSVSLGVGALFGLNENTPDATYKFSLEVEY